MKQYHLFDMDGTLVDSMDSWAGAMLKILEEEHIQPPEDLIRIITPLGYIGTARYYQEVLGIQDSQENLIRRMLSHAVYAYTNHVHAKAGVAEYVKNLTAQGCKCFVLTASPHDTTDICLQRNGLYDLFSAVWSTDDYGLPKSGPEIYYRAAERMGCTVEDIAFYDDNLLALTAGKAAGLTVTGVYDKFSAKDTGAIKALADRYIESFTELL